MTNAYISTLEFNPVRTSHGGEYTCQATFFAGTVMDTIIFIVQIPLPAISVSREPDISVILRHGDPLNLTCSIQLDPNPAVDSDVVVTGRLQGRAGGNSTIVTTSDEVYQIILYVPSLRATFSDTYTCTATVEPGSGVIYVQRSESHYSLNITVELQVSINVSYIPPPGAELGPSEYRAASGPVKVTCIVMGATGTLIYLWTSNCRDCPFQNANEALVVRAAVHSGDNGTHTCTATSGSNTGNASINFNVVGAGIHLFRGAAAVNLQAPKSLPNNGIVVSLNTTSDIRFRFVCRSDSMVESTGTLVGLDGTIVTTGSVFDITHPLPGDLRVENIPPQNMLTASDQGVYTCRIPLQSGDTRDIHIGIYPSGFSTPPNITHIGFTHGPISSNLTCISTGSPATTVTWMRDWQPLTIDGSLYQLTQTVTNRRLSTYKNVLTINAAVSNSSRNTYACTVHNIFGSQTRLPTGLHVQLYLDCRNAYKLGERRSGVYTIRPVQSEPPFNVYCDMQTDGGGWTVFQRRQDGSQDFCLYWDDYERGFGNLTGEFWLGLSKIHRLTASAARSELRIDLKASRGNTAYAKYSDFGVGDSASNYALSVAGYTGTAGDALTYHNGQQFSSKDRDNDDSAGNCAVFYRGGGWWYRSCYISQLNGVYGQSTTTGIRWNAREFRRFLIFFTEMKIRSA